MSVKWIDDHHSNWPLRVASLATGSLSRLCRCPCAVASCLSGNAEMRRIEILVGGELNHLEKYESQWDYPIYEYI